MSLINKLINRTLKKFRTHQQMPFKRILYFTFPTFLLLLLTAIAISWFVQYETANFYISQKKLADSSVKGVIHNLGQLVEQRHYTVTALVDSERRLLLDIAEFPVDEANLKKLSLVVSNRLPKYFTYLLTDSNGLPLLEEKVLKLGEECKTGLKLFSKTPERHQETVVMHGMSEQDYHFDVMVDILPEQNSPIFFVSFRVESLIELIKNSQIPTQSLLIVNNQQPDRIELSSDGVFRSALFGKFLSKKLASTVLSGQEVPGTGWKVLALPHVNLFSDYQKNLIIRASLFYLLLFSLSLLFLRRLWLQENSRLMIEKKLKKTNDELELKVVQRTQELKRSECDLQKTFKSAPYGMLVINNNGIIESINKRATEIFGYQENELLNQNMEILIPEKVRHRHEQLRAEFNRNRQTRMMGKGRHLYGLKKNGREFAIEIGLSPLDHSDGNKVIASISDISELINAQKKIMEEHERAMVTLSSIGDGVITTDIDGEIASINPVAERLSGWSEEDAIGRHISQVFMVVNEKTAKKVDDPVLKCLRQKAIIELGADTVLVHRNGMEIPIEDSAAPIHDADGLIIGAVLVFHDVSQSRAHANEIEYQANHDTLTGLINRREFDRRLNYSVRKARESGGENILLFMDLDRFKLVNDSAGHAAGDELLKQVTKLVASQLRQRDTFARLGGDEFSIILQYCGRDIGLKLANKIRAIIQDFRFFWEGQVYNIGVSIGMVTFSESVETADMLLSDADAACYSAKEQGRNRVQVYDVTAARKRDESNIVNSMVDAFENNRLVLYQQQIKATASDQDVSHYELLVRMVAKNGDIILPGEFLPVAERYGLVNTLDKWVVKTAFEWLAQHQDKFSPPLVLSINLSAQSINEPTFADYIKVQFTQLAINKGSVCFEITETAALKDLSRAREFIEQIKQLGCYFSLDDFGSGYASYSHLKNLPVDYLKIDGMFVKDISDDPVDFSIVKSVNQVAQVLGLKTIAEYVENPEIINKLDEVGVDYLQGYAISMPSELDELLELLN